MALLVFPPVMGEKSQGTTTKSPKLTKAIRSGLVGGELSKLDSTEFKDLSKVELVGVYPNYATAYAAWRGKAQQTVDNAEMRFFIVHLHRLLDPEEPGAGKAS